MEDEHDESYQEKQPTGKRNNFVLCRDGVAVTQNVTVNSLSPFFGDLWRFLGVLVRRSEVTYGAKKNNND